MNKTKIGAAVLAAALSSYPAAGSADELAAYANATLAAQLIDAAQTRDFLTTEPGTFERDPLAKPFVKSDLGALAGVVIANTVLRIVFHRQPKLFLIPLTVEAAAIGNNIRVLERK